MTIVDPIAAKTALRVFLRNQRKQLAREHPEADWIIADVAREPLAKLFPDPAGKVVALYHGLGSEVSPRVLADLQSNGQAAVVFARPTDDRACQVKGQFVDVRPARAEEQPFVETQWARFLDNLEKIGISRSIARGWITWPAVAIRLRASAVFEQTPGPDAGAALAVER